MGNILVRKPGLLTTVQDGGRHGYQQYGVPVSGVMDDYAYRLANLLVGNKEQEAVLEITMLGPELEFQEDMVIALTGADLAASLEGEKIPLYHAILVRSGETLTFKGIQQGCRSYLAIAGGIQVPLVMNSKSTYTRGKMGGYEGRSLKAGDTLETGKPEIKREALIERSLPQAVVDYPQEINIRVVAGPQEDEFTEEGIKIFYSSRYAVTNECDRMGYRLSGSEIVHKNGGDIISDGIAMGAIQVPGHGMPIVMMADRQTTGGYTKIANVITVDLPKMAQAKPGDQIRFQKVTVEEAQALLKKQEDEFEAYREILKNKSPYRRELFRYRKGKKQYALVIEEIQEGGDADGKNEG